MWANVLLRFNRNICLLLVNRAGHTLFIVLAILVGLMPTLKVWAASDTTPPTVTSLSVSPNALDVTESGAAVTVTATFADDLSGFSTAQITYSSPSGKQSDYGYFSTSGVDETFATSVSFQRYAESGTWAPTLIISDGSGNFRTYSPSQLAALGFPATVQVSGVSDVTPASVTSLSVSPTTIDVTNTGVMFNASATFSDNLSGFSNATITYYAPTTGQYTTSSFSPSGQNDDVYMATGLSISQYAESGIWVPELVVADNAGNRRTYSSSDLAILGYNITLNVTSGNADILPPTIKFLRFSVAHPALEAPFGGAAISLEADFSDNTTGFSNGHIKYSSPSGKQFAEGYFTINGLNTGYNASVSVPAFGESGTWLPTLTLYDSVGNSRTYSHTELTAAGISAAFSVYKNVAGNLTAGATLTTDVENDGATSIDPVEASITVPSGGQTSIVMVSSDAITDLINKYTFFGRQISISAPTASVENPLSLNFRIDSSLVPIGENETTLQVTRNGIIVPACDNPTTASPDPCVYSRTVAADGDILIGVHSTSASIWASGFPTRESSPYNFSGFLDPVKSFPAVNSVKAGSAVPVKFSLGGDHGLSIFESGYPMSQAVECSSNEPVNGVDQTVSANSSGLKYDAASNQYSYVWKTDKSWAGQCRQLVLKLKDGNTYRAKFLLQ